ncbi:MAG: restriction endonuclease subunit R [Spirulina sp. SIO3F2]|nr:restriction endonuclease subunit R [Spirulina sp. SIO3F2]
MTQPLPASDLTLGQLKQQFALERNDEPDFFTEWQTDLPNLSEFERTYLDQVKADFISLGDEPLNEEVVKMSILAPLLSIAGFFRAPLFPKAEVGVELTVADEDQFVRGRLDVLVVYQQFWVMAIEAKRRMLALEAGLPQVLFYMLNHPEPQPVTYGLVTNGSDFRFIKLMNGHYALSDQFTIHRRVNELQVVVQILKRLGSLIVQTADEIAA